MDASGTILIIIGVIVVGLIVRAVIGGSKPGPKQKYYVALQIVSGVMRAFGWLIVAFACVLAVVGAQMQLPAPTDTIGNTAFGLAFLINIFVTGGLVVSGLMLIASGELILLFIQVENNTRSTQHFAEQTYQATSALVKAVTTPRQQQTPPPVPRQHQTPPLAQRSGSPPADPRGGYATAYGASSKSP